MPADPTFNPRPAPAALSGAPGEVVSVSALNRLARDLLERSLPLLWVGGEISNLTRAPSGHVYFTLKDAQAQVRCAMWRNRAQLLPFRPENGMRVEARVLVTLYEARGEYQLNVEALRPAGIGSLFEAYTRLKEKLAAEGLFDAAHKRPLPRFPRGIGIVTSPAAAALRDALAALRRRGPHIPIVLYPAPVQGSEAPPALVRAIEAAGRRAAEDGIDVVLLVRGGGSIEDLWAFNDEAVARAIRACPVPVVCGVGHETDFTIADFAADVRAATPTGAAELASAGFHAAQSEIVVLGEALGRAITRSLEAQYQRVDRAALRLVHPRERMRRASLDLTALHDRLAAAVGRRTQRAADQRAVLGLRLAAARPDLRTAAERCVRAEDGLMRAASAVLRRQHERLDALGAHLNHLAPQAVLTRGYAIVRDAGGHILRTSEAAKGGDPLSIQLAHGRLGAVVTDTEGKT